MKKFLYKIVTFAILPLGTLIGLLTHLLTREISMESIANVDSNFKTLFVGDSHIRNAINDSLVLNSANISNNSESYYYTYYKLNHFLLSNKQVENIFLGFSYHNLSNYCDEYVNGHYSNPVSCWYFDYLPISERLNCLNWNRKSTSSYLKGLLIQKHDYETMGFENQFYASYANTNSMKKRIELHYYDENRIRPFSSLNINYFLRIIDLCKKYNVNLILLNTPLHKGYSEKIPKSYFEKYNSIIKNNDLNVFDFSSLELDSSCFIPDGDHVSFKGSILATKYLISNKRILQGI